MNDYDKLIDGLHMLGFLNQRTHKILLSATNAIEQLVEERDAAIEDMDTIVKTPASICELCRWRTDERTHCEDCFKSEFNNGFEWRGVQE